MMPASTTGGINTQDDNCIALIRFDYDSVPLPVAKFLRGQADRIRRHCATSVIQIGKSLNESKRHLSHGSFQQWVKCEVGLPVRTAQAYMRAASWASRKSAAVAHLPPSALYLLSSADVPENFVDEIMTRTEAGETIAPAALRRELKAYRRAQVEVREGKRTLKVAPTSIEWEALVEAGQSRRAISELAAILGQALPMDVFARVLGILTSEVVLCDPELSRVLSQEFQGACETNSGRIRRTRELIGEGFSKSDEA